MMKQTLSFIVALLLCTTLQAKERVIEKPPFCVRNTTSIEVSKVVMSDTATILHIYAKYRPKNWIRIAEESYLKDNNGETYLLRSGIGITPGKEFWMPESGEAEFQLVFPPLPDTATSIDFTEGNDVENGFSIWGIQLKGKKLPPLELPASAVVHKTDPNAELPDPVIRYGKATLKGRLLDYHAGMMTRPLTLILWEGMKADITEVPLTVRDDGSFSQEVKLTATTPSSVIVPGRAGMVTLYLEPGQETELIVNLREVSRRQSKFHSKEKGEGEAIYVNGPLACLAQELNSLNEIPNLRDKVFRDIKMGDDMSFETYKEQVLHLSDSIGKVIDKMPVSRATRQVLTLGNRIDEELLLQRAPSSLTSAAIRSGKITREQADKYFQELQDKMPADYIDNSRSAYLNHPKSLLAEMYYYPAGANRMKTKEMAEAWGTDRGIFFDIEKALPLYLQIKGFTPLSEEDKAILPTLPEALRAMLEDADNELLAKIEANKKKTGFNVNEAGEVTDEDLFASIISKFRGKVLLVDFWATWCGPCRMANKAMVPMKEELKDKDIVYLYITGETSPLKTWENMIPDIHGEHFRLTQKQWDYLSQFFKIEGVPTYLIVDREGNVKYRQTGFPGVDTMKKELLKVTE